MTPEELVAAAAQPIPQTEIDAFVDYAARRIAEDTKERFETSTEPDGTKWPPLKFPRASGNEGPPLIDFGNLFIAATQAGAPDNVNERFPSGFRWGVSVPFAATHQYGATIYPKAGRFLAIPTAEGTVFASFAVIPKRKFIGASREFVKDVASEGKMRVATLIVERAKAVAAAAGWEVVGESWSMS